jgi:PEP-CTERM motif
MKHLLATGLAISAVALITPKAANAASLTINDALETGIVFSVGQFDRGVGFVLDGTTILAPSLGSAEATVSEGTPATGPITHTFTGQFLTGGALVAPTSGVIAFVEAGGGISDILTFTYTGGGAGAIATLTGSFVSDLEPGGSLVAPPGATLVSESVPFTFNNTNITASAVSDVDAVPEPASLVLLGTGLLGVLRYTRKTHRRL